MDRRNRRRLSGLDKRGMVLVGTMLILFVAGGIGVSYTKPPERHPETLCVADLPPQHSILILDKTDPWSQAETKRLRKLILSIRDTIKQDAKLSIFVFNGSFELGMAPRFSLCSPGRGDETNWLWGNPRRVHERFQEAFGRPLEAVLDELTTPSRGDVSPILEIVADIMNRDEMSPAVSERHLILVSDMVQHTSSRSFYRRPPSSDEADQFFKQGRYQTLRGVEVEIRSVRRNHSQAFLSAVEEFWKTFFAGAGSLYYARWL